MMMRRSRSRRRRNDLYINTPRDEVSRMRKVGAKIVPIITGALGTIKNGLYQNIKLLPGHLLPTELQKITLMSTEHIIH